MDCAHGTHRFEYAYQVLAHNLDPSRFLVPDSDRYLPEKAELARETRFVAKLWRISAYVVAISSLLLLLGFLADLVHGKVSFPPQDFGSFVEFDLSLSVVITLAAMAFVSASISRGLTRLRPWGRRAAICWSFAFLFYPLSWYTLWVFFHLEDSKSLYAEITEDAR